ncbi:hypothetical protein CO058_02630 [candidate division WWE3 bacterium CG_4_9_14_0_2_um_filter_35_11]|uniref:Phosphoglycerate kinase n=1 Tax=candidate division WWE3 bacterium CG_4_9_14_0_2_um_filter_35_11 TaxID=1975077 RepID=A0A2M8ELN6_UNCKA|nr:MAG: hypothetical protein COV25_02890 [candidate division WWE3 bacterium CG10_big_fil_rev_8_21_14_0_10_35_32]PJC23630.1 MAG: hypothetical protein CO058_02630 [candidate division WWE3 bacterium CG_4_9_14_0_2_um_filter_35_11]
MELKAINSADLQNKTILYRSPYDIDIEFINGSYVVKDTSRIEATIPTLKYLLEKNCKIVILTWVGRPNGIDKSLSTKPHAKALSDLLGVAIEHVSDCIGEKVESKISQMNPKDILMLENTRFYKEDSENSKEFAKQLTKGSDLIVFDAFPQSHRESASVTGIMDFLPTYAGFYLESEVNGLEKLLDNVQRPYTIVFGGAKISEKVDEIESLAKISDMILIGGNVNSARQELEGLKHLIDSTKIIIPSKSEMIDGLDINKEIAQRYVDIIERSKTVFWAGPLGKYEEEKYSNGTKMIVQEICKIKANGGFSVVAGGDTVAALDKFGSKSSVSYISLAGGATLEFLAGKKLPAIEKLCMHQ